MKRLRILCILLIYMFVICGCGNSENETLQKQLELLQNENKELAEQLNEKENMSESAIQECEHDYEKKLVLQEATCTTKGKYLFVCTKCGEEKEEVLDEWGHLANTNFVCKRCGKTLPKNITMTDKEKVKAEKVQYLSDRQIWYDDEKEQFVLVFSLKDSNKNSISAPAVVDIIMKNNDGEIVYSATKIVKTLDYKTWQYSNGSIEKYQATIYIDKNEILAGSTNYGNIYFSIYNEGFFSFDETSLSLYKLPYLVQVYGVTLNSFMEDVYVGKAIEIGYNVYPDNAADKTVEWYSSDSSIATVNNEGIVTGIKEGKVTITATSKNGKFASCTVTVKEDVVAKTKLEIPELQKEYSYYSSNGNKRSSVSINDITYELVENYNGSVNLKLYFSGEKTYDYNEGTNHCFVIWKLYDEEGYVVDNGKVSVSGLKIGDKFIEKVSVLYLPAGKYRLELCDDGTPAPPPATLEDVMIEFEEESIVIGKGTENVYLRLKRNGYTDSITTEIEIDDNNIISGKHGDYENQEDGSSLALISITGISSGTTYLKVYIKGTDRCAKIKVTVDDTMPVSKPAPTDFGRIKGTITWQYNDFIGTKGDVKARVILIPNTEDVKNYNNIGIALNSGSETLKSGIMIAECDGYGKYDFGNNVPIGEYTLVVVSNNAYSWNDFFNWTEEEFNKVFSRYLNEIDLEMFRFSVKNKKYELKSVNVEKDKTITFSYDFGNSDF